MKIFVSVVKQNYQLIRGWSGQIKLYSKPWKKQAFPNNCITKSKISSYIKKLKHKAHDWGKNKLIYKDPEEWQMLELVDKDIKEIILITYPMFKR